MTNIDRSQLRGLAGFGEASSNRRSRRGFTLIEAMVALGILAVGVLGTTVGHIYAVRNSSDSRHQSVAMRLAEEQLEIMTIMSGDDVKDMVTAPGYPNDPSNPIDPDPGDGANMEFNRSWTITPDSPEARVISITVAVNWVNALGNTKTVRVQTLKADL